ncbi:MAG: hypothetical protein LBQ15_11335 [Clostridium sp.]|nr:hypothetical protein [Clostridium sp.]
MLAEGTLSAGCHTDPLFSDGLMETTVPDRLDAGKEELAKAERIVRKRPCRTGWTQTAKVPPDL